MNEAYGDSKVRVQVADIARPAKTAATGTVSRVTNTLTRADGDPGRDKVRQLLTVSVTPTAGYLERVAPECCNCDAVARDTGE